LSQAAPSDSSRANGSTLPAPSLVEHAVAKEARQVTTAAEVIHILP
jgi:hypothetical protein